ncbi:MAG: HAD hydrolase-like protein [Eubacteriales bacterium]
MKYENVLFDFDGTLADSSKIILPCIENAYRQLGMPVPSDNILRKFIGPPLQESFQIIGMPDELIERAVSIYRQTFNNNKFEDMLLFDGIRDLLLALQNAGTRLAVASVRIEDKLQEICMQLGLDNYFEKVCGRVDTEGVLTKADVVRRSLEMLGNPAGRTVLIGDSKFDEEGAEEMGIDFIAVLYGFGFVEKADVRKSVFIADSAGSLADYLFTSDIDNQ